MSIPITDKFKPKGAGGYALMDAEDVEMPDGTRLSDFKGGASITVDSELNPTSTNPVQNKVIYGMVQEVSVTLQLLQAAIPTTDSINALIDNKLGAIENASY